MTDVVATDQNNILLLWQVIACDFKLHTKILWHVISMKLNIGKKIQG